MRHRIAQIRPPVRKTRQGDTDEVQGQHPHHQPRAREGNKTPQGKKPRMEKLLLRQVKTAGDLIDRPPEGQDEQQHQTSDRYFIREKKTNAGTLKKVVTEIS